MNDKNDQGSKWVSEKILIESFKYTKSSIPLWICENETSASNPRLKKKDLITTLVNDKNKKNNNNNKDTSDSN
ncbi:hypothetical protein QR98_0005630 [Sarcoptes scabiei]|uniref:Uncharacterized protein n=1 Tax=Sarcoptes scabiei TaxID=52283 RepID=A0A131ZTQ8_SARSC|nr:hypothetical protein QR98_0005630 [Sarcoptes scabiei]